MVKVKKNPGLAAFLNLILPGLGYIYAGKRIGFGIGLVIWALVLTIIILVVQEPMNTAFILDGIVMAVLFAFDGYKTAQEVNE